MKPSKQLKRRRKKRAEIIEKERKRLQDLCDRVNNGLSISFSEYLELEKAIKTYERFTI